MARALAARGARVAVETTYPRGAKFEDDMGPAVNALRRAGVDVVLCTGAYQGCGAFVRTARDLGWTVPISNVSFVGSDAMLRLLIQHGKTTGRDYTRALVNSQVVPSYDDVSLPGVVEYRALMERRSPAVPRRAARRQVHAADATASSASKASSTRGSSWRRCGGPVRIPRALGLRQALESLKNFDLGIGAPLNFGPERHQGLDSVYFTRVDGERWVPIADWSSAVQA